MMYAGLGEDGPGLGNPDNADDFFLAIKDGLLGPWGWLLVVAVLISAVSSTQTTILPTARGTLAMGVYRALPARFKDVHPVYKTPSFSTIVGGTVAICYYLGMTLISDNILQDSISSLGLAIAFYYAITGYACVWYFRRDLRNSTRELWVKGIFPLLGALMLTFAFVQSAIDMFDVTTATRCCSASAAPSSSASGVARRRRADVRLVPLPALEAVLPGRSLNRETPVLVPEEPGDIIRSIDGGI
jgi:amino acid transporter